MTGSVFSEKSTRPDDAMLVTALGATKPHWDAVVAHVVRRCDGLEPEWKHYGRKHGWQLKFTHRRRALLYLIPHEGSFLAGMALREPGAAALRAAGLPAALVEEIESARPFPEGRPARVEVAGSDEVAVVKCLLEVKLAT